MFQITEVVKYLLIANVILFLIGPKGINLIDTSSLALYYFESPNFRPWQIISHFFMHGGIMHIFFNMFALVMFGALLERRWGGKRFLFFYLFCALGAAAIHTGVNYFQFSKDKKAIQRYEQEPTYDQAVLYLKKHKNLFNRAAYFETQEELEVYADDIDVGKPEAVQYGWGLMGEILQYNMSNNSTVGASGAIYGLLLAFGLLFPNMELFLLFLPIPIKAKYFIPVLMIIELFLGVNQFSWDNIAHFAHLGGALCGLLLVWYWKEFSPGGTV